MKCRYDKHSTAISGRIKRSLIYLQSKQINVVFIKICQKTFGNYFHCSPINSDLEAFSAIQVFHKQAWLHWNQKVEFKGLISPLSHPMHAPSLVQDVRYHWNHILPTVRLHKFIFNVPFMQNHICNCFCKLGQAFMLTAENKLLYIYIYTQIPISSSYIPSQTEYLIWDLRQNKYTRSHEHTFIPM